MTFSEEWDERYRENTHLSVWPWSDVVSLVRRHCRQLASASRVLELGCGAGANIPFFQALGVQYHAIEGSPSMVGRLQQRFPDLARRLVVGDFTQEQPFATGFDLVVDRAALTHNGTAGIISGLRLVREALKPGGWFIGVDWFSTRYSEYRRGRPGVDAWTKTFVDGEFQGVGNVHFSDEAHLRSLLSDFSIVYLEEKIVRRVEPAGDHEFASWNLVVRRHDV